MHTAYDLRHWWKHLCILVLRWRIRKREYERDLITRLATGKPYHPKDTD